MLNITWRDHKTAEWIREQTKLRDILETISKAKWTWAGHLTRRTDNRWTTKLTFWQPRGHTRNKGRPKFRWRDDLDKFRKHLAQGRVRLAKVETNGKGLRPTTDLQRLTSTSNGNRSIYLFFRHLSILFSIYLHIVVCMYELMCVHTCACMHMQVCVPEYACVCGYACICIHLYVYVCLFH